MNEVYLTGKVVAVYVPEAPASQPKHLMYQLRVSHVNAQKQVHHENFTVNAWRNLAAWAEANLRIGMEVFVRGHLSQRQSGSGNLTEVTALRMTPVLVSKAAQIAAATAQDAIIPNETDTVADQSTASSETAANLSL